MVGRMKHHETSDCCDIFKALSVETRVKIIEILKAKGPLGAKKIAQMIGVTPAAVSQHLKMLKHVGLVRSERRGYWIPYELDTEALEDCGTRISRVCSCECEVPPRVAATRLRDLGPQGLEAYKKKLEAELRRVTRRIEELGGKGGK
jgi:DNA-binding transcriptional ArsR family regulator